MPRLGRKQSEEEKEKRRLTHAKNRGVILRLEHDHGLKVCTKCDLERLVKAFPPSANPSKYGSKVASICRSCRNKRATVIYNEKKANRKSDNHTPYKDLTNLRQKYNFAQQTDLTPILYNVTPKGSWENDDKL